MKKIMIDNKLNGILIVDKPAGLTSHDVVDFIRTRFQIRKIGHSGTLDPMATGLLVVLIGKATKLFDKFVLADKEYEATMTLGVVTDTADSDGRIISTGDYMNLTQNRIESVFREFKGEFEQIPPMVSAVKYRGRKLYELARKGINVPRIPRKVKVYELEVTGIDLPDVSFRLVCSKGTYVRSLCEDIGRKLDCGAHMSRLRRIRSGQFSIDAAVTVHKLKEINVSELEKVLI